MRKALDVLLILRFEGIGDPDSDKANKVVQVLTEDCERLNDEYGADCVWVQEAFVVEVGDE